MISENVSIFSDVDRWGGGGGVTITVVVVTCQQIAYSYTSKRVSSPKSTLLSAIVHLLV